jgi:hypothetical protein
MAASSCRSVERSKLSAESRTLSAVASAMSRVFAASHQVTMARAQVPMAVTMPMKMTHFVLESSPYPSSGSPDKSGSSSAGRSPASAFGARLNVTLPNRDG